MQNETFSDTKVSLPLGGKTYLINFGLHAMRRIDEANPKFSLFAEGVKEVDIIPFLIQQGVDPKERDWTTEDEFVDLYDAAQGDEAFEAAAEKIPLAYQNAMGFINRRLTPTVLRMNEALDKIKQAQDELVAQQSKAKDKK